MRIGGYPCVGGSPSSPLSPRKPGSDLALPRFSSGALLAWTATTALFLAPCLQLSALLGATVQSQQKPGTSPLLPLETHPTETACQTRSLACF